MLAVHLHSPAFFRTYQEGLLVSCEEKLKSLLRRVVSHGFSKLVKSHFTKTPHGACLDAEGYKDYILEYLKENFTGDPLGKSPNFIFTTSEASDSLPV